MSTAMWAFIAWCKLMLSALHLSELVAAAIKVPSPGSPSGGEEGVHQSPAAMSECSSRSCRLMILPLGFLGSASVMTTCFGVL